MPSFYWSKRASFWIHSGISQYLASLSRAHTDESDEICYELFCPREWSLFVHTQGSVRSHERERGCERTNESVCARCVWEREKVLMKLCTKHSEPLTVHSLPIDHCASYCVGQMWDSYIIVYNTESMNEQSWYPCSISGFFSIISWALSSICMRDVSNEYVSIVFYHNTHTTRIHVVSYLGIFGQQVAATERLLYL